MDKLKALWNSGAHHEEIIIETVYDSSNREYYHRMKKGNEEVVIGERFVLGEKELIPCRTGGYHLPNHIFDIKKKILGTHEQTVLRVYGERSIKLITKQGIETIKIINTPDYNKYFKGGDTAREERKESEGTLEKEVKILIDSSVWDLPYEREIKIDQIYIDDNPTREERVRFLKDSARESIYFTHTIKSVVETEDGTLTREECEKEIPQHEYLSKRKDGIKRINKVRRYYKASDNISELIVDRIDEKDPPIYLLELEIKEGKEGFIQTYEEEIIDDKLKTLFKEGKNVTDKEEYRNINLASDLL